MTVNSYWIGTGHAGRLAILSRPRGGDWLEDEARAWARAGIHMVVSLLEPDEAVDLGLSDEASAASAAGVEFVVLPIPDGGVPESRQMVSRLAAAMAETVASGQQVGVHCRQGVGRSALLAACVLVTLGIDPEAAMSRIAAARGLPVPETPEQRQWVLDFARHAGAALEYRL